MKKIIKRILWVAVPLSIAATYLLWPFTSREWDIEYNKEKKKSKEDFLSELVADTAKNKPNIIVLFVDDLGKTDIPLYGEAIARTPYLKELAAEGILLEEGYVSAPICSPSRAGLLTGRYQQRFGYEHQPVNRYWKNRLQRWIVNTFVDKQELEFADLKNVPTAEATSRQGLPPEEITLAELLKKNGYQTAITGKWHLGFAEEFLPLNRGFDYHYGFYEAFSWFADTTHPDIVNARARGIMDAHIWNRGRSDGAQIRRGNRVIDEKEYLTDKIADEAIRYIEDNKDKPFFLYVPFNAPHTPFQAFKKDVEEYQAKGVTDLKKAVYYAMITNLDSAIGRINQKVKELGLEENTLIVFLSDNGGATYTDATDNAPLKGGKMTLYEGGLNVPFIVKWKGKIQSGTTYRYPVSSLDIFATAAAVSGASLPSDRVYDGVNIIPYLSGKDTTAPHPALYWRTGPNKAIRQGDWKLVLNELDNITALYNLANDKNETTNLALSHPEKVEALKKSLQAWEQTLEKPRWPSSGYFRSEYEGKPDRYTL
jgi:arylsulfatase A-like enzyme